MARRAGETAGEQPDDDEPASRRPTRGSADELLDAGAHAPIDAMRHSTAHVMAEAVLDLFPGAKLGIGPGHRQRLLLRLRAAPAAHARRPRARSRRGWRESVKADHPFVRQRGPVRRGPGDRGGAQGQAFKVEILDDLARKAEAAGEPLPPTTFYEHGPFSDLCKGPHVASTGKIGPFKLLAVAGAYWRGDEKRPMLQRIYGTVWETQEELDRYLWRRAEAKKRDHRKLGVAARPVQLPRRLARIRLLAPEGPADLAHARDGDARAPGAPRLRRGVHADPRPREAVAAVRPLGRSTPTTCSWSTPRARRSRLKPMNCPESTFIYRSPAALVPRPAAALQRVRAPAPQRAVGRRCRA